MVNRLKQLRKSLRDCELDALLVRVNEGDNQNVLYLSGFGGTTAALLITRAEQFIVTDARYFVRAKSEAKDFKLVKVERGQKVVDLLNETLSTCNLGKKAKSKSKAKPIVGFEAAHTPVQIADFWKEHLKAKLVPTIHLVERFRQYKDKNEIEQLRHACKVTSRVYYEVAELLKPGMTETQVAFELDMRLRKYGAVSNSFTSIVASSQTALCRTTPLATAS